MTVNRLIKNHTGEYLAQELRKCLKRYGISKKILGVVADNAANNNTLVEELESLGGINSAATRVRCFAHILNLIVKVCLVCSSLSSLVQDSHISRLSSQVLSSNDALLEQPFKQRVKVILTRKLTKTKRLWMSLWKSWMMKTKWYQTMEVKVVRRSMR